jgi:hypothetical protein
LGRTRRANQFKVQEDFAELLDVTQAVVSSMEAGRIGISSETLIKLIKLNLNPVWLMTGKGDMVIKNMYKALSEKSKPVTNEDILKEIKSLKSEIKKVSS